MFERLAAGATAYGAFTDINQPEIAEIAGAIGLDFICIDMMMGAVDWNTSSRITLAAERHGITPAIRLPAFPWAGSRLAIDRHISADIVRAVAGGAQAIFVSLETPEQVQAALLPAASDHRRVYLPAFEFEAHGNALEKDSVTTPPERAMLFPLIESQLAIDLLDEILAVPGLEGIFLGMGDLSVILGHPNDYAHPDLIAFVQDVINRAAPHDVCVFVNIHGRAGLEDVATAVREYEVMGARGIFVPRDSAILLRYYRDLLARLRGQ